MGASPCGLSPWCRNAEAAGRPSRPSPPLLARFHLLVRGSCWVRVPGFWEESTEHPTGLMAALADPGLGRVLAAMHEDPAESWTLDGLARKAAMSRTLFAERFRDIVGQTPYSYLTDWRMQNARRHLATSSVSLQQIASRVGYDSAASFSRAFKKAIGSVSEVGAGRELRPGPASISQRRSGGG